VLLFLMLFLKGERGIKNLGWPVELEITQKSFPRIEEKTKFYLGSSEYDYVLYLFLNEALLECYRKFLEEKFKEDALERFLLFQISESARRILDLKKVQVGFRGENGISEGYLWGARNEREVTEK